MLFMIIGFASLNGVYSAGECPDSTPDEEATKLLPCVSAAQDSKTAVSKVCCTQVKKLGQNSKCLCAVMLSDTAKSSGVKPEIAITIPKRCNITDRPVGYKCGGIFIFIYMLFLKGTYIIHYFLNFLFQHFVLIIFFENLLCSLHFALKQLERQSSPLQVDLS